jgi:hexokinase
MRTLIRLPAHFPNKKILSIDIGGTLAKAAFYVPNDHKLKMMEMGKFTSLTHNTIPSKPPSHIYISCLLWHLLKAGSLLISKYSGHKRRKGFHRWF